jgi:hypothetical protein
MDYGYTDDDGEQVGMAEEGWDNEIDQLDNVEVSSLGLLI